MATALRAMSDLDKIWKDKNIFMNTKLRLYKALKIPIAAMYGTALKCKVEGVRRQGRPHATWLSEVKGRENLTLHQSSLIAQNRASWKELEEILEAHARSNRKRA